MHERYNASKMRERWSGRSKGPVLFLPLDRPQFFFPHVNASDDDKFTGVARGSIGP